MPTQVLLTGLQCFNRTLDILKDHPHARIVPLKDAVRTEAPADRLQYLPGTMSYARALILDAPGTGHPTWIYAVGALKPSAAIKHERDLTLGDLALFRLTNDERRHPSEAVLIARLLMEQPARTSFLSLTRTDDIAFHANDDTMRLGRRAAQLFLESQRNIIPDNMRQDRRSCFRYGSNVPARLALLMREQLFAVPARTSAATAR